MIEKIASSLPIQVGSLGSATPVPEGKGFAEELATATKANEVKPKDEIEKQTDDPEEDKKNGCCGNDDKSSAAGAPFAAGRGTE